MSNLKGKRILIFQQRGWGKGIGRFLAKKLYGEGCVLAALTSKRSTHELIVNQPDVKYELIVNHDDFYNDPKKYLEGDVFPLEEICKELEIDSVWPLIAALRQYVKSYRDKYYYSFKQNIPDEGIVDYLMASYKCVKRFFDEFKPDVIVSPNFVSTHHLVFSLYAKKKGVPMIAVVDPRIKGFTIFARDYLESTGVFYEHLDKLNARLETSPNKERAIKYMEDFRKTFIKPEYATIFDKQKTLKQKIRYEISPYMQVARWFLNLGRLYFGVPTDFFSEYSKFLGPTPDYKTPRIILRDHYAQKSYIKAMNKFDYYPFDKVKKFVYFPLQFQPEATIEVAAPFFTNQIETARQTAMSLPDDYTLVVKEHPGMVGYRPPSYIEKIARTPNIKLIDYRISSAEILKKAALVVSPNGTTVVEAAFYYKPVIQLGNLGTMLKLPNVYQHTDMTTLAAKIKELMGKTLKSAEFDRRLENYIAACFDKGLYLNYYGIWERGEKGNMDALWDFYFQELSHI